eukprot:5832241-Pleurochrysis_carterae.AAC.1
MNYCISFTAVANRRRQLPVDISPCWCERRHPSLVNAPLCQSIVLTRRSTPWAKTCRSMPARSPKGSMP